MRSPPAKRERIDSPPRASRYEEPRSRAQRYLIPIFSLTYWPVVQTGADPYLVLLADLIRLLAIAAGTVVIHRRLAENHELIHMP